MEGIHSRKVLTQTEKLRSRSELSQQEAARTTHRARRMQEEGGVAPASARQGWTMVIRGDTATAKQISPHRGGGAW